MDHNLTISSPDSIPRAISPGNSSTRPNPFDNGEDGSRKRRRTSPTTSSSSSQLGRSQSSHSATVDVEGSGPDDTPATAMNIDIDTVAPHTPEPRETSGDPPPQPSSSRVTINLRNAPPKNDSPSPTMSRPVQYSLAIDPGSNSIAGSDQVIETPSSDSASPPIEILEISDEELAAPGILLDAHDAAVIMSDFPFRQALDEPLHETVNRIANHICSQQVPDPAILERLNDWLSQFLTFTSNAAQMEIAKTFHSNTRFWLSFPSIVSSMISRRPPVHAIYDQHRLAIEFYYAFTKLNAVFLQIDKAHLEHLLSLNEAAPTNRQGMFSHDYLSQLHSIMNSTQGPNMDEDTPFRMSIGGTPEARVALTRLDQQLGGSLQFFEDFVLLVSKAALKSPQMHQYLGSSCSVFALLIQEARQGHWSPRRVQDLDLARAHGVLNHVLDTTRHISRNHVAKLNKDTFSGTLDATQDLHRLCLQGDHELALDAINTHRHKYPNLAAGSTTSMIALESCFEIEDILIRSTQMQIRILAIEMMSQHLLSAWTSYNSQAPYIHPILNHLSGCLVRLDLVDYLLGPTCHPEVTFHSSNIVGFLAVTKTYEERHIDRLWQAITSNPDPRVSQAVAQLANIIFKLFDYEGLLEFCERFQSLPFEGYTGTVCSVLTNWIDALVAKRHNEQRMHSYQPFGLWLRLLQDSFARTDGTQSTFTELQQLALDKYERLGAVGVPADFRQKLYRCCMDDIARKTPAALGSLWALEKLISNDYANGLDLLVRNYDLTTLIVSEFAHAASRHEDEPHVLSGNANKPRREFLLQLLQWQSKSFSEDVGRKLWEVLVGPASSCITDREVGWGILTELASKDGIPNSFIQTCVERLPTLPLRYLSAGAYRFIRSMSLRLMIEDTEFNLDDEASVDGSCLGQLWRIALEAPNSELVQSAINTIAREIYTHSSVIKGYPLHRIRQVQSQLVSRCFRQMQGASTKADQTFGNSLNGDNPSMVILPTQEEVDAQSRIFTRSLRILRCFLEAQQLKSPILAGDWATDSPRISLQPNIEAAHLKYQSFDGEKQTDIKQLSLERQSTGYHLLARLREETGFDNYRLYYHGNTFVPTEQQLCQSLSSLNLEHGLLLVKREDENPASSLKSEIMVHFEDLWQYLNMDEAIAREIFNLIVLLPPNQESMSRFANSRTSYKEIFPADQPFRAQYNLHVLVVHSQRLRSRPDAAEIHSDEIISRNRLMMYIAHALRDGALLSAGLAHLRSQLNIALMCAFGSLLQAIQGPVKAGDIGIDGPSTLLALVLTSGDSQDLTVMNLTIHSLRVILVLGFKDPDFGKMLVSEQAFSDLFRDKLIFDIRVQVRQATESAVRLQLDRERAVGSDSDGQFTKFFLNLYEDMLPLAAGRPKHCLEYFRTSEFLLSNSYTRVYANALAWAQSCGAQLIAHEFTEEIGSLEPADLHIHGLASLLVKSLEIDESVCRQISKNLTRDIFLKHLVPFRGNDSSGMLKAVLSNNTRARLYDIVFRIIKADAHQLLVILQCLNDAVPCNRSSEEQAYIHELPHHFERYKALRAPCGYVGLRNLSNTCYMNSLMTQLFMNTRFRQFVLSATIHDPEQAQYLLHKTAQLFGFMQNSYKRFIDPHDFIGAIKTVEGANLDIHVQMDVDEIYNLFIDRMEGQLSIDADKKTLRSFYGGQLVQQVKSKECEHISERLEPFSAIQCDIKGKSNLHESLQAYVDGEVLEGENKYKCSQCDRHVDAVKRACFKDLPDNLIFHLKRFDFNLKTFTRNKINDYFSFPHEIDLAPYTADYACDPTNTKEDMYELCGIITHTGTAESGHYYSFIRERPSLLDRARWLEFNDENVSQWDPINIEQATFGGAERSSSFDGNALLMDKPYSAYMLFYVRASTLHTEMQAALMSRVPLPLKVDMEEEQRSYIEEDNEEMVRRHCLFDPSHTRFAKDVFALAQAATGSGPSAGTRSSHEDSVDELKDRAMIMAVNHFDQIVSRTKDMPFADAFMAVIAHAIKEDSSNAIAFLNHLTRRPVILRSLLQRHPDVSIRRFIGTQFVSTFQQSISLTRAGLNNGVKIGSIHRRRSSSLSPVPSIANVVEVIDCTWRHFPVHTRAWDEYFDTVLGVAKAGDEATLQLLQLEFLPKLAMMIMADPTLSGQQQIYQRMLQSLSRRPANRPASFVSVIDVIAHLLEKLEPTLSPDVIVADDEERLGNQQAPFAWSEKEIVLFHQHPEMNDCTWFVEKLIAVNQNQEATHRILSRLMGSGDELDHQIVNTIRYQIRSDTFAGPYLKAAVLYAEQTRHFVRALRLASQIAKKAMSLDDVDGRELVGFFQAGLALKRPESEGEDETSQQMYSCCIDLAKDWAPCLLSHKDAEVRVTAARLLHQELLRFGRVDEACDVDMVDPSHGYHVDRLLLLRAGRQVGIACFRYLKNIYVDRAMQISRAAAENIITVARQCRIFFVDEANAPADLDGVDNYTTLETYVTTRIQRLVIEEFEDDASDWEGSAVSSDAMEGFGDAGVAATIQ